MTLLKLLMIKITKKIIPHIKVINHFNSNGKHSDSSIERILLSNKDLYEFSEGNEIVPKLREK